MTILRNGNPPGGWRIKTATVYSYSIYAKMDVAGRV
jgi:hypothetical protein